MEEMCGHHLYANVCMTLVETSETKMTDARTRTPRVTASTCTPRKGYVRCLPGLIGYSTNACSAIRGFQAARHCGCLTSREVLRTT